MEQINEREGQTSLNDNKVSKCRIIEYENIQKRREKKAFNLFGVNENDSQMLRKSIIDCFEVIKDKDLLESYTDIIKECFEISCYVLYDRQIMQEVISKQKDFAVDYVADFLRYILRVFVRQYNESPILTKNQCADIKTLCRCILKINNSQKQHLSTIERISSKEIVEVLKAVAI